MSDRDASKDRDWTKDKRYNPRFVAAKYRPKPTGRDLYPETKRREAAQRRDEQHHDIDFEGAGRALRAHFARLREQGWEPDQPPSE
jgi:hypothetical protein